VQSTDTIYNANLHGPWAPKYYPNTSHTAELVEDAEWDLQYSKFLFLYIVSFSPSPM
jgi:hypothetical protein